MNEHKLLAEIQSLQVANANLREQLAAAQALITQLQARLDRSDQAPPPFVKPNKPLPATPRPPRRKCAPEHSHGRPKQPPTEIWAYVDMVAHRRLW